MKPNETSMTIHKIRHAILFTLLLGGCSFSAWSQTPRLGITVTGSGYYTLRNNGTPGSFNASGPRLGFTWQDHSMNSHEIKVGGLSFGSGGGTPSYTSFHIGGSYQYRHFLLKNKQTKVQPYFLAGAGAGFGLGHVSASDNSSQFSSTSSSWGAYADVGLGARWTLSEKVYLDVAIPITVANATLTSEKTNNPSILDQSTLEFNSGILDVGAEVSLGVYIGNRKPKKTK